MSTTRLAALVGLMLVVGMAVISVRSAVWVQAYELGRRQELLSRTDVRSTWLEAEVLGLRSPAALVHGWSDRGEKFVAWSPFPQADDAR